VCGRGEQYVWRGEEVCCRVVKSVCGRVRSLCGEGCGSNVEVSPEEMKNVPWRAVGRVIVNKTSHYSCGWPLSHINIGRSAPHPELQYSQGCVPGAMASTRWRRAKKHCLAL
jgi:hypothetical protein